MEGGGYREWRPDGALSRQVACLWTRTVSPAPVAAVSAPHVQRVVPDGCLDVMWSDGRLWVAGPDTGPVLTPLRPGSVIAGLRFRPGAAPAALGVPAAELLDARVDLAALWGEAETARLAERLHAASGPPGGPATATGMLEAAVAATGTLEAAVAARLRQADTAADPLVAALVGTLTAASGPLDVAGFAEHAGLSERQLRRRCISAVGYGPKTLDRVLRLQRFLALAHTGPARPLAWLAAEAGYADQAHLSRECRALTGVPPREMVGRRTDEPARG